MLAEWKNKFIVINRKHLEKISKGAVNELANALARVQDEFFRITGRKLTDKQYAVCNMDEPYAEEIKNIILKHEEEKINKITVQYWISGNYVSLFPHGSEYLYSKEMMDKIVDYFINDGKQVMISKPTPNHTVITVDNKFFRQR